MSIGDDAEEAGRFIHDRLSAPRPRKQMAQPDAYPCTRKCPFSARWRARSTRLELPQIRSTRGSDLPPPEQKVVSSNLAGRTTSPLGKRQFPRGPSSAPARPQLGPSSAPARPQLGPSSAAAARGSSGPPAASLQAGSPQRGVAARKAGCAAPRQWSGDAGRDGVSLSEVAGAKRRLPEMSEAARPGEGHAAHVEA